MKKPECFGTFDGSGALSGARKCKACGVLGLCVRATDGGNEHVADTPPTPFEAEVRNVLEGLCRVLVEKNRKYGNSALNPKRVFSCASAVEQIKVRLDDKISRLMNQQPDEDEDVELDLMGYLVLLRIAKDRVRNGV